MEFSYQILILSILMSGMVTGFITFRMHGMRLAPHFIAIILAFIATLTGLVTGNIWVLYATVLLQFAAVITAFTQTWAVLKYNFQTAPSYAPHLALMALIPVLTIASVL